MGAHTDIVHNGERDDVSAVPIYQAATVDGSYSRDGHNPTIEALEEKIRSLERGQAALVTASGMAAISHTLLGLLSQGSRLVTHQTMYSGVQKLLSSVLPRYGIELVQVDMTDLENLRAALDTSPSVVYFEPIANPYVDVIDAPGAITMARECGATVMIDNTFLSPYLFKPLDYGAQIVVHSATKYLCGHGDTLGGAVITASAEHTEAIREVRNCVGGILSPGNAFLIMRGIKTMGIRMDRHSQSAMCIAKHLDSHPRVHTVFYPGLPSSPGHDAASSYLTSFGGMIGFETTFDLNWDRVKARLRMIKPWVSLGDTVTLVTKRGPRRIRLSVGLEDVEDIIADLELLLAT